MSQIQEPLFLDSLSKLVVEHSIDFTYNYIGADYVSFPKEEWIPTKTLLELGLYQKFAWKNEPSRDDVRRLFNQINTFYAGKLILKESLPLSNSLLVKANEILLFRQNKSLGFRTNQIEFGLKKNLPFNDSFRKYKWFLGMHPEFIDEALKIWNFNIARVHPSLESAIFLTMALIAIHPFSDANGRLARLIFSRLMKDWHLGDFWLNEGKDGELLRLGDGLESTEFLMGQYISEMTDYKNNLQPGASTFADKETSDSMFEQFAIALEQVTTDPCALENSVTFVALRNHLQKFNHVVQFDPRFLCLRSIIRQNRQEGSLIYASTTSSAP